MVQAEVGGGGQSLEIGRTTDFTAATQLGVLGGGTLEDSAPFLGDVNEQVEGEAEMPHTVIEEAHWESNARSNHVEGQGSGTVL